MRFREMTVKSLKIDVQILEGSSVANAEWTPIDVEYNHLRPLRLRRQSTSINRQSTKTIVSSYYTLLKQ